MKLTFDSNVLVYAVAADAGEKHARAAELIRRAVDAASWALVSEAVDERLRTQGAPLGPEEWRSGTRLHIVDLVAPFGGADAARRMAVAAATGEAVPGRRKKPGSSPNGPVATGRTPGGPDAAARATERRGG